MTVTTSDIARLRCCGALPAIGASVRELVDETARRAWA
jgi:hypothetical protein